MKKIYPDASWLETWRYSYPYDLQEIYGELSCHGYAYAYASRRRRTLEMVARAAAPPARVLDLAGAQGNFSLTLAELGYDVTWNDLRADLVDYVKLKYERGKIQFAPGNVSVALVFGVETVGSTDAVNWLPATCRLIDLEMPLTNTVTRTRRSVLF